MEIEQTPLYNEYLEISNQGPLPVNYYWTMQILANGKTIYPVKVISILNKRQYNVNYADDLVVRFVIGAGTYHYDIYPYQNDLKVILFKGPIGEVDTALDLSRDIDAQLLRATLMEPSTAVMEANRKQVSSKSDMDIVDVIEIDFALTDLTLEQIRMVTVDGIYRDVTTAELIRHILTIASAVDNQDVDTAIQGVDRYEPFNETPIPSIIIPTGTCLYEVPDYLNSRVSGVYNAGFGYYLQNKNWYMYPLYDTTRYENSERGLTIVRLPADLFHGSERTYRRTRNQVIILVGDEASTVDTSEILQLNVGNGTRFADADKMFDGFGVTQNNRTTVTRKENNSEYLAIDRPTGYNNVQVASSRITTNAFVESSKMAARLGMYLSCAWDYSDPGALWPGMPVKYMFMANGQVFESFGILQATENYTRMNQPGLTVSRYVTSSSLLLFLGKPTPWE